MNNCQSAARTQDSPGFPNQFNRRLAVQNIEEQTRIATVFRPKPSVVTSRRRALILVRRSAAALRRTVSIHRGIYVNGVHGASGTAREKAA